MLRPTLDACRAARARVEALLTRGLRAEVLLLRQEQAACLDRIDKLMAAHARMLQHLAPASGAADTLLRLAGAPGSPAADADSAWRSALRNLGVLNYENSVVSGERLFLERCLARAPRAVVLDIGANEGQFAELCRACEPEAVIHSVEPHPRAFAILADEARRLRVHAHRLALSDAEGEAEFYDYADQQGSQHASLYRDVIEAVHGRPAAAVPVTCTTLDRFAAGLGLDRIDLLKIDTEGHELAILRGAKDLLARGAVEVIQFEFNEMNVISRVFMKDFFEILPGYRLFRLLPIGAIELARYDPCSMEIFAYQNIVAVRRDLDTGWLTATGQG